MMPTSWEEERIIGYNIVYRYNGRTFETRTDFEPGSSLRVRVIISPIAELEVSTDLSAAVVDTLLL